MKRILLAVMLSIGVWGFAQNIEKIIKEQIVDKIKNYKPTDLVPYSKDGKKWALMDVKSRKILTDFILNEPSTFNPDIYVKLYGESGEESEIIYSDYRLESEVGLIYPVAAVQTVYADNSPFQVKEKRRIKVDETKYKYILKPILYKEKYYAIATKKDNSDVLINEKGEEQKGFHFKEIYKDKESEEDVFNVEDFDGKKGLITILGKKKLYGELMNNFTKNDIVLGYVVQKDNDYSHEIKKSGVVDLVTQEWLIKPQEKYKIYDIIYTSSEELKKSDETDRNKVTVYFLATDQSGQRFVLDINGNPILPKN